MTLRFQPATSHARRRRGVLRTTAMLLFAWVLVTAAGTLRGCERPPETGEPLAGLTPAELERFELGRAVFQHVFTDSTGLGPLFNAASCLECHDVPVAGGSSDEIESHHTLAHPDGTCDLLTHLGGPVFQQRATAALTRATGLTSEPIPPEANVIALRTAPDMFGFGLIAAVPEAEILRRADPDDLDRDGISGRPNRFFDGTVGRLGRKALVSDLASFNAAAFPIEMSVTVPNFPDEMTIGGKPIPAGVDPTPEPELDAASVAFLHDFVRFLAPPPQLPLGSAGRRGRSLFESIGCVSCHTPTLTTGPNPVKAFDQKKVNAYSDLLLHDMGAERADICLGLATPSEFRTEPLMGLRFATRYLHDGAAKTLEEAIDLHAGEATGARDRWRRLSAKDRAALLEFLRSL